MGITERRQRQKEEIRAKILATAWKMVTEEGWQSVSVRKIADAIEYSVPVIYEHFESKEKILSEFGKDAFRLLSKKIQQAKEKSRDPSEQLRAIADAYWHFALKNKEYYQLMFGLGMPGCEIKDCFPERDEFRMSVMQPIEELFKKSKDNSSNIFLKYHTFWSILHGLIAIKLMNNSGVTDELNKKVLDDAIEGFIRNLG